MHVTTSMHVRSKFSLRLFTSWDSGINTRFYFSDTHFCFNNDTVNMDSVQNPELLLPLCLLQGQQALLNEQVALLKVRRRRCIQNRRRRSCLVRHWLSEERRPQFGHYDRLLAELRMEDQQSFFHFLRMPCLVHDLFSVAYFKGGVSRVKSSSLVEQHV